MRLVPNSGADRVINLVHPQLKPGSQLGYVTPSFSLFAYAELRNALVELERVQLILPPADDALEFLGGEGDRTNRNRLKARWLANQSAQWLTNKVDLRRTQIKANLKQKFICVNPRHLRIKKRSQSKASAAVC